MRWPTRQLQASVEKHLREGLTALDWFADPPVNTAHPVVWDPDHDTEGLVAGGGPQAENLIGLSVGDVPDTRPQEIGQGLVAVNVPVFVDIYGENRSVSLNLSDDVMGILQGEVWSNSRYVPFYDFSVTPALLVTDRAIEARIVEARWPGQGAGLAQVEWKRRWRVVSFTATCYFNTAAVSE